MREVVACPVAPSFGMTVSTTGGVLSGSVSWTAITVPAYWLVAGDS